MTKLRDPDSIEEAVTQARALLGESKVMEITDRRSSMIKAWSDPDEKKRQLPLRVAKLLDRELIHQGHEPLFLRLLEASANEVQPALGEEEPLEQAMNCVTSSARALEETQHALKDKIIQPHARISLLRQVTHLQKALGAFKRSLFVKPVRS